MSIKKIRFITGFDSRVDRCGVGAYAEKLIAAFACDTGTFEIDIINFQPNNFFNWYVLVRAFFVNGVVHYQYPLERWQKSIIPGLLPLISKIFSPKTKTIITLHEWQRMHFLRRLSILPAALFANHIIFVSAQEVSLFNKSFTSRIRSFLGATHSVIPIGVNVNIPMLSEDVVLSQRESLIGDEYEFAIGFFGFIYDSKQPYKMLDVLIALRAAGVRVKLIICGDFPSGHAVQKADFIKYLESAGITKCVEMMGYIDDETELLRVLSACDVNVQLYDDGVSTRRGSFWYSIDAGFKVVTTAPNFNDEFTAACGFNPKDDQNVLLVDVTAGPILISNLLFQFIGNWTPPKQRHLAPSWSDIARSHRLIYTKIGQL